MNIEFLHTGDKELPSFLERLSVLSDSTKDIHDDDDKWKEAILMYINKFFSSLSRSDKLVLSAKNEKFNKEYIRDWLMKSREFTVNHLLRVNLEPQNYSSHLGYYDIKFESSLWNKYFVFECKCLNNSEHSIIEYVYNPTKKKYNSKLSYSDGGVYRFIINKYAYNIPFGGMIGFIQKGHKEAIKNRIIKKLEELHLKIDHITYANLLENGIFYTPHLNDFNSSHYRFDIKENKTCDPITIHHVLLDFTISK